MALKTIAGFLFSHDEKTNFCMGKFKSFSSCSNIISFHILLFWKIWSLLFFTYLGNNSTILLLNWPQFLHINIASWKITLQNHIIQNFTLTQNTYHRLYTKRGGGVEKDATQATGGGDWLIFKNSSPSDYNIRENCIVKALCPCFWEIHAIWQYVYITHQTTHNKMTWEVY